MRLISAAVAACFASHLAFANPTGPTVVNGQVTFHQQGNLLQITNSPSSIINWQSFSIGTSEITRFLQQSSSSAVLNRVTTQNPSSILGALQSNGRVLLINPNGILFGAGAQIDVAGLVASTLRLSDTDFLAGRLRFTEAPGAGSVINQGTINVPTGGHVYLVGPAVTNGGVITSPKGEVILAAGNSVELVNPGTPNLRVEITAPDNQAINLGQIVADSGRVGIYAGLINQSGTIRADSAVVTEDGRIVLKATKGVNLDAVSVTAASGVKGGDVTVETETGTIRVAGQIDARGSEVGGAINIAVTGESGGIDLGAGLNAGNATVNLSGPGQTLTLNSSIVTAGEAITINDSVVLGDPALITLDTTDGGLVPSGANVTITGTVNDDMNPSGLVLSAGNFGTNTLGSAVGDMTPIASLMASGNTTAINGGLVNTTGNQTYNRPVTLGTDTALAATGPTANIAVNNSLSSANSLTMNAGGNINIGGNVSTGPQFINVGGGLIVQSSAAGSAQLTASGGQTINAGYVEVTAQDNPVFISNNFSGDQLITTTGMNASGDGLALRNLGGVGAFATIGQNVPGGTQVISVNDADRVTIDGVGGTALIFDFSGPQTVSISGATSANALNLGSPGSLGASQIGGGGTQSITAGLPGEQGSITIIGKAAGSGGNSIIVSNPVPGGTQTVSTPGTLTVIGGTSPADSSAAGIFANGTSANGIGGQQTINAGAIILQGGPSESGNNAQIGALNGAQQIDVGAGGISLQGGAGGTNNSTVIFGAAQDISTTGNVTLSGGPGTGNSARIGGRGGAMAGPTNLALEAGGNVVLTGGSSPQTAAIIGNSGTAIPTQIAIIAGGDVIANSGAGSGARIGSNPNAPAGGDISISAGGDIQLNGTTQATRIHTLGNVVLNAGGSISESSNGIVQANVLATTSNAGTSLTGPNQVASFNANNALTDDIALSNSGNLEVIASNTAPGGKITVNNSSGDLATSGSVAASGGGLADIALVAGDSVNIAHPVTASGSGSVLLTGGAITVDDTSVVAGGSVSVNGASLDVKGKSSGALIQAGEAFSANVSGDLRVRSASTGGSFGGWAVIVAEGTNSNTPAGELNASSSALGVDLLDRIAGHGPVNISAGNVALEGGGNIGGFAMITGGPVSATATGNFNIAGGSGLGAFGWVLSSQDINLTIGGNLTLNSGTGLLSFARMQTVHPTSLINVYFPNLPSGGYSVNGVDGAYRDGLSGFFAGPTAARPGLRLITTYGE